MSGEAFSLLRQIRHILTTRQTSRFTVSEMSTNGPFERVLEDIESKNAITRLKALAIVRELDSRESAEVLRRILHGKEPELQLRGEELAAQPPPAPNFKRHCSFARVDSKSFQTNTHSLVTPQTKYKAATGSGASRLSRPIPPLANPVPSPLASHAPPTAVPGRHATAAGASAGGAGGGVPALRRRTGAAGGGARRGPVGGGPRRRARGAGRAGGRPRRAAAGPGPVRGAALDVPAAGARPRGPGSTPPPGPPPPPALSSPVAPLPVSSLPRSPSRPARRSVSRLSTLL